MYLVCGEALFDVFAAPAGARRNHLTLEAVAGGSPFNVAVGLSRLGTPAALFTGMSQDHFGQQLRQVLEDERVDTRYLIDFDAPTTLAMVAVGANGSPIYSFRGEGCADRLPRDEHLAPLGDEVRGIHVGSYSIVTAPIADTLLSVVRRESGRRLISLDPNIRLNVEPDLARWRERVEAIAALAHLIKVSDEDLALLYPGEAPEAIAHRWLQGSCELALLTRGDQGAQLFSAHHGELYEAAVAVNIRDTVGAGDTFQAALLSYLHAHRLDSPAALAQIERDQLQALLSFAVRAAAITCSRRGPDLPYRYEIA
ncbi:carbohydrate kinase family protein [Stutzerimonas xanthomarina]|uniref:Fructokinase n=2 Tax=Stutzerimonas xanthomarina TaxID=271420 RepID=A0A1M5N3Y5_9GAMM|nr:carbohydrate kinase [Stutzerimonas xanthomarina]MCP9337830.1 carbohydrate kinase [Stutzerimonas xanthomarina]SEH83393.1 fructokinase [Stutzerimonas xanthomarina]SHG84286.1 fructokinase [Stutzerimonas xanthomarina DSM 18231]